MTKKTENTQGFTLVELIIAIAVIAILVAISTVIYSGVQDHGKRTSAQSLAAQVIRKAEAWNDDQNGYASYCQFATATVEATGTATGLGTAGCTAGATAGPAEAKLESATSIRTNAAVDETTVRYQQCGSGTGARVSWAAGGQTGDMVTGSGC